MYPDMTDVFETAEQEQAREAAQEQALAHRQMLVDAMFNLMQSRNGRELVRWMLGENGAFEAQFDDNPSRAQYREGRRHAALLLLALAQEAGVADKLLQSED